MLTAVVLIIVGTLWLVGMLWWRAEYARDERADLVAFKLTFPKRLSAASIEAFACATTGIRLPWWKARFVSPIICFETVATSDGVSHFAVVSERRSALVQRMLQAHLPQVRVERTQPESLDVLSAAAYRLNTSRRELRLAPTEISAGLLHALAPVGLNERVVMQWIITPTAPVVPPEVASKPQTSDWRWLTPRRANEARNAAEASTWRTKQRLPQLLATVRIGAVAVDRDRERTLIRRVEAALHPSSAPGVQFRRRQLPERTVARQMSQRRNPLGAWPVVVNSAELAQLLAWPIEAVDAPGVKLSGCVQLPVPTQVPNDGTIIGDGFAHGRARRAALDHEARTRHVALVGPTGTGKSTMMLRMAVADAVAGHGVLLVDPKRQLVDDYLSALPASARSRVAVLDPSDSDRPVGINPLAPRSGDREAAVANIVSTLHRVWHDSWGVRSADLIHQGLRSLLVDPSATLIDLLPLFTDPAFRRKIVARQTDPILVGFWRQFNGLSAAEQAQYAAPLGNKLRQLFGRPSLRRVFGQPRPAFDLVGHLNGGGIVAVSLNSATIGEDAAALYGSVVLGMAWSGMQARASIASADRKPWALHLDEFARIANLPVPLEGFLATARGFDVSIAVALQHLDQVPADLRSGILSNVRSTVSFQLSAADARLLAPYFGQSVTAEDLQGLERYEVIARLHAAGTTQPPCTLRTLAPPVGAGTAAQHRTVSARRWGADGVAVDTAIAERLGATTSSSGDDEAPAGRKRRAS